MPQKKISNPRQSRFMAAVARLSRQFHPLPAVPDKYVRARRCRRRQGIQLLASLQPTVDALEKAIGALEDTPPAVCFRTGMAAISTLFLAL